MPEPVATWPAGTTSCWSNRRTWAPDGTSTRPKNYESYSGPVTTDTGPDTSRLSPPARRVVHTEVTEQPIEVSVHSAMVAGAASGAVVSFAGVVRDHDGGRPVTAIEYVGHPTSAAVL